MRNKVSLVVVELVVPIVKILGEIDLLRGPEGSHSVLVHLPDLTRTIKIVNISITLWTRECGTDLVVADREEDESLGRLLEQGLARESTELAKGWTRSREKRVAHFVLVAGDGEVTDEAISAVGGSLVDHGRSLDHRFEQIRRFREIERGERGRGLLGGSDRREDGGHGRRNTRESGGVKKSSEREFSFPFQCFFKTRNASNFIFSRRSRVPFPRLGTIRRVAKRVEKIEKA